MHRENSMKRHILIIFYLPVFAGFLKVGFVKMQRHCISEQKKATPLPHHRKKTNQVSHYIVRYEGRNYITSFLCLWCLRKECQESLSYLVTKSWSFVGHKTRLLNLLLCWLDMKKYVWQWTARAEELLPINGIKSFCSFCSVSYKEGI